MEEGSEETMLLVKGKEEEKKEEEGESNKLERYPRRWIILAISCFAISLRGFNQSCYGPINSVLSKFLRIHPWQVDWFILTQSVVFLTMALPLSWFTARIGFKNSYIFMTLTLTIGFILTTTGVSMRTGYPSAIVGQCIMGFSNIVSWSIPPPTAAIWFPTEEVATAVALQVVGRGVGESIGSLTPLAVSTDMSNHEIGFRLMWIFVAITLISVVLCIAVLIFVIDEPPLPPSESRAKAIKERETGGSNLQEQSFSEALAVYKVVVKELFSDPYFVCVWIVFGVANPVLRNNSVLLSSVLHTAFVKKTDLNDKAGFVLMGGWIAYTVGGFIAGPLITKTRRFKGIVLFSVGFECLSSLAVLIGMWVRDLICVYTGVVSTGLFLGMANTSLFELLMEITYPKPPMLVTMINIIGMGIFRLLYPIIGRVLLSDVGATASMAFPFVLLLMSTIILLVINPPYRRLQAEHGSETQIVLEGDERDS